MTPAYRSVIPIVSLLLGKLQASSEDVGLLQIKAALRDAINRRFADIKTQPNLAAATLLDPRFKDMYFSAVEKDDAKAVVLTFLRQRAQTAADKPDGNDNEAAVLVTTPANQPHTSLSFTGSGLWEDYDNYTHSDPELTNSDIPSRH